MPLPIMVFLGVKVDLPAFNAAETILVCPNNFAMLTSVPNIFCLSKCHMDIPNHKLRLYFGWSDFLILMGALSKNAIQLYHLLCGWV